MRTQAPHHAKTAQSDHEQDTGDQGGVKHLADIDPGHHRIENQRQAGREKQPQAAAGGEQPQGEILPYIGVADAR